MALESGIGKRQQEAASGSDATFSFIVIDAEKGDGGEEYRCAREKKKRIIEMLSRETDAGKEKEKEKGKKDNLSSACSRERGRREKRPLAR